MLINNEEPEVFIFPNIISRKRKKLLEGKTHLINRGGVTSCGIRVGLVNCQKFERITLSYLRNEHVCKSCRKITIITYTNWLYQLGDEEEIETIFFDT